MKLTALLTCAAIALPVNAGELAFSGPAEPPLIVPEGAEQMGSAGVWIPALLALVVIAAAVHSSEPDEPDGCEQDCNPPPPDDCTTKYCVLGDYYGEEYGASKDAWKLLPKDDRADVRDYWELTGGHGGIGDWSQYPEWLASQ